MKIERMTEIETPDIQIGDRIHVDHYTATCQKITPKGAIFLLDQYLDKAFPMNWANTNKGGYPESDLRKALQSDEVPQWIESDSNEQWPLMTDAHNRTASRCGDPEWGWLANTVRDTSTVFCRVNYGGSANRWGASSVFGVRPVFQIAADGGDKR